MKLKVHNIGRVESADIDLQGITVVAGENGSGKSTVSKSLFAILEIFYNPRQSAEVQRRRSESVLIRNWLVHSRIPRIRTNVSEIREQYYRAYGDVNTFIDSIWRLLEKSGFDIVQCSNSMSERIIESIKEFFYAYQDICERSVEYYARYSAQIVLDSIFKEQINCLKGQNAGTIGYQNDSGYNEVSIIKSKIESIEESFFNSEKMKPIYITTSDLMSIIGDYKRLYSAEKNGTISYVNSQLTKLLMEEVNIKELIAEDYQKLEEQKQVFDEIFNQVLEGEIYLDNNQLTYHDNWCDENIELQNIASGMKIFLILKRLIHNGVFLEAICLIIDEPETNLHPEWQLILAHLLVLMNLRLQVKVYVNSHSPYFVRAMEYYANEYQALDKCNFYMMHSEMDAETGLFWSEEVTQKLGVIYDKLAEPFNQIM